LALANNEASAVEPKILCAEAIAKPEERDPLPMRELLAAWDEDLANEVPDLGLAKRWDRFIALRRELAQHLDALVHLPPTWLAGKPALAKTLGKYLEVAGEIYGRLQTHYRQMVDVSQSWARAGI